MADIGGIGDLPSQIGNDRLQVEHGDRIAVVGGAAECLQYELQAVGKTVSADFPLVQFELVQDGFEPVLGNAVISDLCDDLQHQFLQVVGMCRLAAAAEHQLPHGILQATQGGGRQSQFGGFQGMLQRRSTVFQ